MTETVNPERPSDEALLQRLLHRFIRAARAHHTALETLNAEQAKTQARILSGLHEALLQRGEQGVGKLLELVDSDDPVVASMAAVYSLHHDSGPCLAALRRVAQKPGLLGFRAGIALERWEGGEWDA